MEVLKSIFFYVAWAVHVVFQKLLFTQSTKLSGNSLLKSSKMIRPKRISRLSRDIIDYDVSKRSESAIPKDNQEVQHGQEQEQPVHLLFDEKKSSLIDLSDIVTPVEEEMLRCLCAKGFEKNPICIRLNHNATTQQVKACTEVCIPRDIFTNVWINSCVPT